jgi:hypothetical protein
MPFVPSVKNDVDVAPWSMNANPGISSSFRCAVVVYDQRHRQHRGVLPRRRQQRRRQITSRHANPHSRRRRFRWPKQITSSQSPLLSVPFKAPTTSAVYPSTGRGPAANVTRGLTNVQLDNDPNTHRMNELAVVRRR